MSDFFPTPLDIPLPSWDDFLDSNVGPSSPEPFPDLDALLEEYISDLVSSSSNAGEPRNLATSVTMPARVEATPPESPKPLEALLDLHAFLTMPSTPPATPPSQALAAAAPLGLVVVPGTTTATTTTQQARISEGLLFWDERLQMAIDSEAAAQSQVAIASPLAVGAVATSLPPFAAADKQTFDYGGFKSLLEQELHPGGVVASGLAPGETLFNPIDIDELAATTTFAPHNGLETSSWATSLPPQQQWQQFFPLAQSIAPQYLHQQALPPHPLQWAMPPRPAVQQQQQANPTVPPASPATGLMWVSMQTPSTHKKPACGGGEYVAVKIKGRGKQGNYGGRGARAVKTGRVPKKKGKKGEKDAPA